MTLERKRKSLRQSTDTESISACESELQQLNNNKTIQNDMYIQKEITQFVLQEREDFLKTNNYITNHKNKSFIDKINTKSLPKHAPNQTPN